MRQAHEDDGWELSGAEWQLLDQLLAAALQRNRQDRAAFLGAADLDGQTRERLLALLDLEARTPVFLEGAKTFNIFLSPVVLTR